MDGTISQLPSYLHPEGRGKTDEVNLPLPSPDEIQELEKRLGIPFEGEGEEGNLCFVGDSEVRLEFRLSFAPDHVRDYTYALLHSHAPFNKSGAVLEGGAFEIPHPRNLDHFWKLVQLGGELRQVQPLDGPSEMAPVQFPMGGSNLVERPSYRNDRIYINDGQYFEPVPQSLWEFSFGDHLPVRHWLEIRKGNRLGQGDIGQYQELLGTLSKLIPLVGRIDKFGAR